MPFERKPATIPKMTALRRLLLSRVDRYVLHAQVGIDILLDARRENDIIVKGLETEKFIRREKLATFKADIAHWKKCAGAPLPHHYFALLSSRSIPDIPPLTMEAEDTDDDDERLPRRTCSPEAQVAAASSPSAHPEVAPAPPALELEVVAVAEPFMAVSDALTCQDAPQEDVVAGKDEPEDEDAAPLPEVTPAPQAHELAVVPFSDPFVAVSDVVAIRDARLEVAVVGTGEVEETAAMSLMEWKPTTTPRTSTSAPPTASAPASTPPSVVWPVALAAVSRSPAPAATGRFAPPLASCHRPGASTAWWAWPKLPPSPALERPRGKSDLLPHKLFARLVRTRPVSLRTVAPWPSSARVWPKQGSPRRRRFWKSSRRLLL